MDKKVLPEFQNFLISKKLAFEKNVPYYALWASKFLSFYNCNTNLNKDLLVLKFMDEIKKDNKFSDWQISQAEAAVKLYLDSYLKNNFQNNIINREPFDLNKILEKMREAIRIKHYAFKTERVYSDWVKRFYYYLTETNKKDINTYGLNSDDVRNFLSYLAINQRVASSTQNQAFNALLFLYKNILNIEIKDLDNTVRAKRGVKLPVVLSVDEIKNLFKFADGTKLLIIQLIYGSGLRLMELARLRVKDVDFGNNLLFVRGGKGDKDRTTILPECLKSQLQKHIEKVKKIHEEDLKKGFGAVFLPDALDCKYPNAPKEFGWQYVFPSANLSIDPRSEIIRRHHINEKTIQNIVKDAVKKAGILKNASVHTLRHSFATHLLMKGVNIREIQDLLGHKSVETTMIYTHVMRDMSNAPKSPLDNIFE